VGKRDNDPAVGHLRPGRGLTTEFAVETCGASDWVASRLAARAPAAFIGHCCAAPRPDR
jgi:hypothetical protein